MTSSENGSSKGSSVSSVARAIYLRPLKWKVAVLSVVALVLSTNVFTSLSAEGNSDELAFLGEEMAVDYEPTATSIDGFLVKPSLQTSEGQRTGISEVIKYTVKRGDTISYLAARFNISTETLLWANNMESRSTLKVGQELMILPVDGLLYKVQKDDNLDKIAKKYNIAPDKILAQNSLKEPVLPLDKQIILPGAEKIVIAPTVVAKAKTTQKKARFASLNVGEDGVDAQEPGAAEDDNGGFSGTLAWPVAGGGRVTQKYSSRHLALDITYGSSTQHPNILAADGGTVVQAEHDGYNGGYGHVIVVDHGGGIKTRYAHNGKVYVSVGDKVRRGQVIAVMGNTGRVYGKTGIHSHFEVIVGGKRVNPYLYY